MDFMTFHSPAFLNSSDALFIDRVKVGAKQRKERKDMSQANTYQREIGL